MIFLVSELYYPEEVSTGYILTKIAEGIAEKRPVHVITGPPTYSGNRSFANFEVRNNVVIERVQCMDLDKNKLSTRLIRSIIISFKLVFRIVLKVKKGDVIFVVTNPAPLLVLMGLVSKVTGAKLVILVHDVFPENLVAANVIKKESWFYKLLLHIFNKIYSLADQIIVIGRDMQLLLEKKTKLAVKISVITNWADTVEISPSPRSNNQLLAQLNIENKFIVQFAGNLGRVQGIDQLLEAAISLRNENVHFLFIGDGARKKWLLDQVLKYSLTNVTCLNFMAREEQQLFLNACDVSLVSLAAGMTGLGVPSKAYNIFAAGKPVIAIVAAQSEIGILVNEKKLGWVVTPGSSTEIINTIKKAMHSNNLQEIGERARKISLDDYSLNVIIRRYQDIFCDLD